MDIILCMKPDISFIETRINNTPKMIEKPFLLYKSIEKIKNYYKLSKQTFIYFNILKSI
jgi:hypothetical protein